MKKNEKKKSESVKSVRYMVERFFRTNNFSVFESCYLHIIAKYKPATAVK